MAKLRFKGPDLQTYMYQLGPNAGAITISCSLVQESSTAHVKPTTNHGIMGDCNPGKTRRVVDTALSHGSQVLISLYSWNWLTIPYILVHIDSRKSVGLPPDTNMCKWPVPKKWVLP